MTITHLINVFTDEQIQFILSLPEVTAAKAAIDSREAGQVYFSITLTAPIKEAIRTNLGLDLSSYGTVPMRWVKGDTHPHVDRGVTSFENTYLTYLTSSAGELVLGDDHYPIRRGEAFVFQEGIRHETVATGTEPRLLLGPMSELASPVGGLGLVYFPSEADALASNYGSILGQSYTFNYTVGYTDTGSNGGFTSWRIASNSVGSSSQLTVYRNGDVLNSDGNTAYYYLYPATPCFLEGTKILARVDGSERYVPIETLRKGDLVKTSLDGFQKVELIGKGTIQNPGGSERTENRLYSCSPADFPELDEELVITGDHSILVDSITEEQRAATVKALGKIFVTDKKYRLIAQLHEKTQPWGSKEAYTIWHLALENSNETWNYGIYVNGGLLVETCSIRFLKNKSNMMLV